MIMMKEMMNDTVTKKKRKENGLLSYIWKMRNKEEKKKGGIGMGDGRTMIQKRWSVRPMRAKQNQMAALAILRDKHMHFHLDQQ